MAAAGARGTQFIHGCRTGAVGVALAALAVTGCNPGDPEPGLFGREPASSASRRAPFPSGPNFPDPAPLPSANPALPVAGESVWTSADGLGVQVRIAAHAVRRVDGGTVLDWSVTPIRGATLRPGDPVPATVDLGLIQEGRTSVVLLDSPRRAVYRPVSDSSGRSCVCTPVESAQRRLRVGSTTLLQTAYPELPTAVRTVDVSVATVPLFYAVPVTAAGRVPVASRPTDLTRPADGDVAEQAHSGASEMFRYGEQVFRVRAIRVLAGDTGTSLEWAIVSVTGGAGVDRASTPPFARPGTKAITASPAVASGPTLGPSGSGSVLQARVLSDRRLSDTAEECLCTDLRGWAAVLRRPDKMATVVTNYPPLRPGTGVVEVGFAGLATVEVPVTVAPDAARALGAPAPAASRFWRSRPGFPQRGWEPREWPTPVPTRAELERASRLVDRLVR